MNQLHDYFLCCYWQGSSGECVTERTCQNGFQKLRLGKFPLKGDQRSGRSSEISNDQIKAMMEANRHQTVKQIADNTTIENLK